MHGQRAKALGVLHGLPDTPILRERIHTPHFRIFLSFPFDPVALGES
jgi:hypothetical protein